MDNNLPKKWRKDYAKLLNCWALIKTSEMIKQLAYNQIKSFKAEEKALNRLKNFMQKNESKTMFEQTVSLWEQSMDEYLEQNNCQAAAECLDSLSEIQLNYGSELQKKESLNTMLRAFKYHKRANDNKKAIISLKRALTILELSSERDINGIAEKYEECSSLYKSLNLHDLAKLSQKIGDFFGEISPFIKKSKKKSRSFTADIRKKRYHSLRSFGHSSNCWTSSNSSDETEFREEIESKELVQKQIQEMAIKKEVMDTPIEDNSDYPNSDDINEDIYISNQKYGSKKLLVKNVKNILSKNYNKNDENFDENSSLNKETNSISVDYSDNNNSDNNSVNFSIKERLTTEITVVSTQKPFLSDSETSKPKRKRRLKAKEESEETPQKRIIKLNRENIKHYFQIDETNPQKKLFCYICRVTVYSYRWSTVTDHLNTQKHINSETLLFNKSNEYSLNLMNNFNYCSNYYEFSPELQNIGLSSETINKSSDDWLHCSGLLPSTSTSGQTLSVESVEKDTSFSFDFNSPLNIDSQPINDQTSDYINRTLQTPDLNIQEL